MKLTLVFLVCLLAAVFAAPRLSYISVTNGGTEGSWQGLELCPSGTGAAGFSIKVDPGGQQDPFHDATNLNGIRLHCNNGKDPQETVISSGEGTWGIWESRLSCIGANYVSSFQLQVQVIAPNQTENDLTGANNIQFKCTNGEILMGKGVNLGDWGEWSPECKTGICGIETRIEEDQGRWKDDSGLNDVRFLCC